MEKATIKTDYVLSVIDRFIESYFDDSILVWDRKTIEKVVKDASDHSMRLDDKKIMNEIKKLAEEGRLTFGSDDSQFIKLNKDYWDNRNRYDLSYGSFHGPPVNPDEN